MEDSERALQEEVSEKIEQLVKLLTPFFDKQLNSCVPAFRGGAKFGPPEHAEEHWHILGSLMLTPNGWAKAAARIAKQFPIDGLYEGFGIDGQPRVVNDRTCYIRFAIPAGDKLTLRLEIYGGPAAGDTLLMDFYAQFTEDPSQVLIDLVRRKWRGDAGIVGPKFELGKLVITPGAAAEFKTAGELTSSYVTRHVSGDWGDVGTDDGAANDGAIAGGDRILSVYSLKTGERIWIITEADRSTTTIMLPDEY